MLGSILKAADISTRARYIVFTCADLYGGQPYYESIDLIDAFHPQTILAWSMNDQPLGVGHGAPLRLRVERRWPAEDGKGDRAVWVRLGTGVVALIAPVVRNSGSLQGRKTFGLSQIA